MKNFKNSCLVLLFSLSFCLVSIAQEERVGGISNGTSTINTLPSNEINLPTGFSIPEITTSSATQTGAEANDVLLIDAHLLLLLIAGIVYTFYKFK